MRFITREQPYERRLAAGRLRYQRDGQATGAVEHWRLTAAMEGYRVLHVDLDAREAPSGQSTLFHLMINGQKRPERLKFRFWDGVQSVRGNVQLEETLAFASRSSGGRRLEEELVLPAGYAFWFPATVGLGLLAPYAGRDEPLPALTLSSPANKAGAAERMLALEEARLALSLGRSERLDVAGRSLLARPLTIRWPGQQRTVWLDEDDWPLQMARGDGLLARETRYMRFAQE